MCNGSVRIVLVSWVIWVGLSRISVGAHFPADVVAGYAKSIILVWLLRISIARVFSRGREYTSERPRQHNP
jgi:membrane-associated phospholipid phosphatase